MVAWQPVGAAMGVVDVCARYIKQREQFGAPLASFQLIQERMVRMLATVQAMFLMAHRLTKLYEEGRMTHEQASLVKVRAGEKVGAGGGDCGEIRAFTAQALADSSGSWAS